MLASFPASMVNQKSTDLGIPDRFSLNSSRSSKPLPQIDPKLVADCKIQNPNFGQRVARPPQPGESAIQASPPPQDSPINPPSETVQPPVQSLPGTPPPQAPPSSPTVNGGMEE
jgi:hypothetical protein